MIASSTKKFIRASVMERGTSDALAPTGDDEILARRSQGKPDSRYKKSDEYRQNNG